MMKTPSTTRTEQERRPTLILRLQEEKPPTPDSLQEANCRAANELNRAMREQHTKRQQKIAQLPMPPPEDAREAALWSKVNQGESQLSQEAARIATLSETTIRKIQNAGQKTLLLFRGVDGRDF